MDIKIIAIGKNSENKIEKLNSINEVKKWLAEEDYKTLREFRCGIDSVYREFKQKVIFSEKLQRWIMYDSVKEIIDIIIENDKVYFIQKTTDLKKEASPSQFGWIQTAEID